MTFIKVADNTPKKEKHSLGEGLKVVVSVNLRAINHSNLSKNLKVQNVIVSLKRTLNLNHIRLWCLKKEFIHAKEKNMKTNKGPLSFTHTLVVFVGLSDEI